MAVFNLVFALRGLLAFVAFSELTTSCRCLFPAPLLKEDFIGSKLLTGVHLEQKEALVIISHLFGIVTLFTGLSLFHLAVFTHYRPLVSLSLSFVTTKFLLLVSYALFFEFILLDHNVVFPLVSGVISIAAISIVPWATSDKSHLLGDENKELVRKMRKRHLQSKQKEL